MKILTQFQRTVLAVMLLLPLTACTKSTKVSTKAAGHAITATLEGSHAINTEGDRAVITGEFGSVTIEAARMRMGDGAWTKIPEGMPVALGISKHKRWVTVGGVSVKESSY
jgi:hypothetical protein